MAAALLLFVPGWSWAQDRALRLRPPTVGAAGKRIALVIGNNLYPQSPLKNAASDALLMANVLSEIGFAVEPPLLNGTALDIERAVRTFAGKLEGADVGFFFYAGHGISVEGKNYLLGVDFSAEDELEAKHKAVEADLIADRMDHGGARLNLIVMDACRNNPFKLGKRSEGTGLGTMQAGRGMLIALATAPGKAASDNPGGTNGLFTMHLAEEIKQPGLGVKAMFDRVKAAVIEDSGGEQRPWVHDDVVGDVALVAGGQPAATEVAGPVDRSQMELAFWNSIVDSRDPRDFEGYLQQVASGAFGGTFKVLAENRLADARAGTLAASASPRPAGAPPSLPSPSGGGNAGPARGPALPVGYLDLTGAANTQVFIDGKEIGRLPFGAAGLEDALFLTEGSHEIKLLYPGYLPLVHTVTIRAGETTPLFVDLGLGEGGTAPRSAVAPPAPPMAAGGTLETTVLPGRLELTVSPDPGSVLLVVDGREATNLPGKPLELPPGDHSLSLLHPAFKPFARTVTIRSGETVRLAIDLKREGSPR